MADSKRCCCNCERNIRHEVEPHGIECYCEIDGTASDTLNALRVGADDGRKTAPLMGWKNRENKKVITKL